MRNRVFHVRQTAVHCIELLLSDFWCSEAAYNKSCFTSSCALVVSRGGFALARNTSTVLSRASMPASCCWPTELDTAATDDSMARNLPGRWASHSRCSQTASCPDSTCCTPRAGAKYSTRGANAAITAGTGAMYTTSCNTVISQAVTTSSRVPDPTVDRRSRSTVGPQRWSHNMCLEPRLDRMCCVLQCQDELMTTRMPREFEPCLATGSSCGRQRCRATSGIAFKYAVDHWQSFNSCLLQAKPCRSKGSSSASFCIHSGPLCARQQHLLVPAPSEVARAATSALLKIGKQALHTSYTSKVWPNCLLADAAVSTSVFAPPVMPVHDTRLRFGGVMRFRTKRISQRSLHRAARTPRL